ncbi:MAG TPA: septation protein SepH [Propionibacteriaceae bacterium]|nr:septation protein SepH [Propionibacteriaceae bacterium]
MRTARVVGLSRDGQTLIVATSDGAELGIPADDRLHAALRGDRPRLGQLEIEMDSALTPRDIQSRIRAGESLEEVAAMAGIPLERVERFAAPVIAEREYVASQAKTASVRRRGETSGHRNLRVALTERLLSRGVDIETVEWDSFRMEDGRWSVSASYRVGEAERSAIFYFDVRGRFSVAGNDEARWVLGEQTPGSEPGGRRGGAEVEDTEPTIDLSDELALVRAIQEPVRVEAPRTEPSSESDATSASVTELRAVPPTAESEETAVKDESADPSTEVLGGESDDEAEIEAEDTESELEDLERGNGNEFSQPGHFEQSSLTWDQDHEHALLEEAEAERSELETLYGMLGGDGYAEDSIRVYSGLSDASAVPETDNSGWEPAIVVDYPVEPSVIEDGESNDDEWRRRSETAGSTEVTDRLVESAAHLPTTPVASAESADEPHPRPGAVTEPESPAEQETPQSPPVPSGTALTPPSDGPAVPIQLPLDASEGEPETEAHPGAPRKSAKRKRAAVPSWDEIMFGGPKRPE